MEHLAVVLPSIKGKFPFYISASNANLLHNRSEHLKQCVKHFIMADNCPREAATHTLTHSHSPTAGKKPTVFGRPRGGGRGAGHANDPSLDIWGEGGGWLLGQLAGSFSDLNGSDSTHTKNV